MTYINWSKPFEVEVGNETFQFPTYGNYGGGGYSAGRFGKDPPVDEDGSYLSNRQLGNNKDALDYAFYRHDVDTQSADTTDAEQQAADLALLRRIGNLSDNELADPEASFYAGVATIAFAGVVVVNNPNPALADRVLPYINDGIDNIETGLSELSQGEVRKAISVLEEILDTFQDINFPGADILADRLDNFL
jgi:hypothetical protein